MVGRAATTSGSSSSLAEVAAALRRPGRDGVPLAEVAAALGEARSRATGGLDATTLRRIAAQLDSPAPMQPSVDLVAPVRPVALQLIGGRGHYERVIAAVRAAHTSVWVATANVKELLVEPTRGSRYVSILAILDELAATGVELRLLHAELPSGPFRAAIARYPRLLDKLALRRCPRVHLKVVIVDGALLYLGSANWTGAGLGAKGSGRRNFELGIATDDAAMLDQVQALYEHLWQGGECAGCRLRADCPGPLDELGHF